MKLFLKILKLALLIIFFPVGMLYCVAKAVICQKKSITAYLGMIFLVVIGFAICFFWLRPDLVSVAIEWIKNIFTTVA